MLGFECMTIPHFSPRLVSMAVVKCLLVNPKKKHPKKLLTGRRCKMDVTKDLLYSSDVTSQELPLSVRIPDTKSFDIETFTTNGSVILGIISNFSLSRNIRICISSSCLLFTTRDLEDLLYNFYLLSQC